MKEALKMSNRKRSKIILNATSSPELERGATRYAKRGGQTINQSGPDPAHANLSARQARERGLLTSGTYGPPSTGSSRSANLALSLGNRLREKQAKRGSTLYRQTWRWGATPSGRLLLRLVVSVPRTCGEGFTGWPTPTAMVPGGTAEAFLARKVAAGIHPSLTALNFVAELAQWPTVGLPGGSSPSATWRPSTARGHAGDAARLTVNGEMLIGSSAEMGGGGRLNPDHSRWLMGLPPGWDACGVMAIRSLRPRHRRS